MTPTHIRSAAYRERVKHSEIYKHKNRERMKKLRLTKKAPKCIQYP